MLKGKNLYNYKKGLALTTEQREILIGTLLGDATIPAQRRGVLFNVKFEQSLKNREYVDHLYGIFKDWVGTPPRVRAIDDGDRHSVWFRTYRHAAFSFYRHIFYDGANGRKLLPRNLHQFLTPRVLAYWFMDDGSRMTHGYKLSTYAFTKAHQVSLCKTLAADFGLRTSLHLDGSEYYVYIWAESISQFNNLVKPYILPCFAYKLFS